jgi:hypothetical protein
LQGHPLNVRGFDNRQDGGEHIEILQISKISQRCQEPVTPIAYCAPNFNANTSFASYPVVQRTTNEWRLLADTVEKLNLLPRSQFLRQQVGFKKKALRVRQKG